MMNLIDAGIARLKLVQRLNLVHNLSAPKSLFGCHEEGEILSKKLLSLLRHDLGTSSLSNTDDSAVLLKISSGCGRMKDLGSSGLSCTDDGAVLLKNVIRL